MRAIYTNSYSHGVWPILGEALSYATGRKVSNNMDECQIFNYGAYKNGHHTDKNHILYNTENSLFIKSTCWHKNIINAGRVLSYSSQEPGDYFPLRYFPFDVPKAEFKDIDVLFCGFLSERRIKILNSIKKLSIFITEKQLKVTEYKSLIARSKVVLSIKTHQEDYHNDCIRVIPLLSGGANVITERSRDDEFDKMIAKEAIIVDNPDNIADLVHQYLERTYDNTQFKKNHDLRIWTHRTFGEICL